MVELLYHLDLVRCRSKDWDPAESCVCVRAGQLHLPALCSAPTLPLGHQNAVKPARQRVFMELDKAQLAPPSDSKHVGFAIVGLGRAGHFHLTSMKSMSDSAKLRWVVDTDSDKAAKIAEREGCRATTSIYDALSDPLVDAVIISSVTYSHFSYCKAALAARKAVFTEKPISHDPEELREIIDLACASKCAFIVGYQRRVDPNFRELRRQVHNEKAVGELRLIKCCSRDNPLPPLEYLRVSGGIFYDMLCHDFDMINFLADDFPVEVFSVAHCYNPDIKQMGDVDMVVVTLKFASGLIATVDCSRVASYGYDQRVEVFGELGMANAARVIDFC